MNKFCAEPRGFQKSFFSAQVEKGDIFVQDGERHPFATRSSHISSAFYHGARRSGIATDSGAYPDASSLVKPEQDHFGRSGLAVGFCEARNPSDDFTMTKTLLPRKAGNRMYRFVRWNLFSVYRQLFTITFFANFSVFLALLVRYLTDDTALTLDAVITAASANFCMSIVSRNEHFVNLLFALCVELPKRSPHCVRRNLAKIYNYGGIHSGCAVAGIVWYILFAVLLTYKQVIGASRELPVLAICWTAIAFLLSILVFAHPGIRSRLHNHFEAVHRYVGWTVIMLFWVQTCLVVESRARKTRESIGHSLVLSPTFWFLVCITLCIVYPWARLRARNVRSELLSEHAVRLHFDYTKPRGCTAVKLTDSPLKETHAFAVIPAPGDRPGYSVIVSDAGDWTKRIIKNNPTKMYTRGAPQQGVIRVAALFTPVVIVATGSGIGPCLGLFTEYPNLDCRVLWSTASPESTYGSEVIDAVRQADPNAVIVDTRISGRQDMVAASYALYQEAGAEAVVIISNGKLTWKVVYGLETRGVPAYGPIWDC
jgi:hypothetical protein